MIFAFPGHSGEVFFVDYDFVSTIPMETQNIESVQLQRISRKKRHKVLCLYK